MPKGRPIGSTKPGAKSPRRLKLKLAARKALEENEQLDPKAVAFVPSGHKNRGPYELKLDEKKIIQMAMEDCSVEEIAAELSVHRETIYERFGDVILRGRDLGNKCLRWKLFQLAMSGNVPILIWLSKQRLGYKDRPEGDVSQINFNVTVNEVPK